jgi:hypothetical protein
MTSAITHSKSHIVSLPQIVEAQDYHDFVTIEEALNQVFEESVKVEEIGFNAETGQYEGLAFCGRSAEIIKKRRHKELEAIEQANACDIDFDVFRGASGTSEALLDFAQGRIGFTKLKSLCSYVRKCRTTVVAMEQMLALGTARRAAYVFCEKHYDMDED